MIKVSAIVSVYKGSKYLKSFLANVLEQSAKDILELVVVHNDSSPEDRKIFEDFAEMHPGLIKYIVVPREELSESTNRAIRNASGEYVCVWNVDDLRTANSIQLQMEVLDRHPRVGFTYGDYVIVREWLGREGKVVVPPEFSRPEFIRSMHLGPFYMWRKSLCQKIGYWDEQCLQGADYEYAVRLACECEGKKSNGNLGYYLDEGMGMSTGRATLQPIERTFIDLRYWSFSKLDFWYLKRALKYNLDYIKEGKNWVAVRVRAPHARNFHQSRWMIMYALVRWPFWIVWRVVNFIKRRYV